MSFYFKLFGVLLFLFFWSRIPCWFGAPHPIPFVVLFGRGVWGSCRFELSEDITTNGNTSHISVAPPFKKRMPLVAQPYLSSAIVLSCLCYYSLRLWTFVTALGNCRNMTLCSFSTHGLVLHINLCVPFPPIICLPGGFISCPTAIACGVVAESERAVVCHCSYVVMFKSPQQHYLRLHRLIGNFLWCKCCKTLYILQLLWNL